MREAIEHVGIKADWCNEDDSSATVLGVHQRTGRLIDPHTAIAVNVATKMKSLNHSVPTLICSTAHFGKFPSAVASALGWKGKSHSLAAQLQRLSDVNNPVPASLRNLTRAINE